MIIHCLIVSLCNRKLVQTIVNLLWHWDSPILHRCKSLQYLVQDRLESECAATLQLVSTARTSWVSSNLDWSGNPITLFDLLVSFMPLWTLQNSQTWLDFYSGFPDVGINGLKKKFPKVQRNRTLAIAM